MSTRIIDFSVPTGVAFTAPEFEFIQANTNSDTFVTVLEITGGGRVYLIGTTMSDLAGEIRTTIDGIVTTKAVAADLRYMTWHRYAHVSGTFEFIAAGGGIVSCYFQDNFKVEHRVTTGVTVYTKVHYGFI